jgi:hypothetical protein
LRIPDFGVEVTEGLPGSGKSFFELSRTLDWILQEQRPVFTNLPIRFRVLRHWLKHRYGEAYARLIFPLTEQHFRRFLKRSKLRAKERDAARLEATKLGKALSNEAFDRAFAAAHGPDVYAGPDANWIYPTACIIIDEGHHWFPMSDQKNETPELLGYLTMLRHHLHKLVIVTQDRMQVSITFRRLCQSFWAVRNRGEDKVAWGIKCRHLGITGFAYVRRTPDQEAGFKGDDVMSAYAEQRIVWPWLPSERWKFRLYDSFTHIGSKRRMEAVTRRLRESLQLPPIQSAASRAARSAPEMIRTFSMLGILVVLTIFAAAIGGLVGYKARPVESAASVAPLTGKKLTGVSDGSITVSGKRVPVGGVVDGVRVVTASRAGRRALLLRGDDELWVWRVGSDAPTRAGSLRAKWAAAARAAQLGTGSGKSAEGTGPAEALGAQEDFGFVGPAPTR